MNAKKVNDIFKTKDYSMFTFGKNRKVTERAVSELANKIKKRDMSFNNPICVYKFRNKYKVIDGQHRLLALKKLNKPVFFFVATDSPDEYIIQNTNQNKPTSIGDCIDISLANNNVEMKKAVAIWEKYPKISRSFFVEMLLSFQSTGQNKNKIKDGNFKIRYKNQTIEMADIITNDFGEVKDSIKFSTVFLRTILYLFKNNRNKDILKMINNQSRLLCAKSSVENYLNFFGILK